MNARLPQLDRLFLTDAGLESDMIYNRGIELPCFSSLMLLRSSEGREALKRYFSEFLDLARRSGTGCLLETATWRASSDWAGPLGLSLDELDRLNREAVALLVDLRDDYASESLPVVISGCIGPRGDGYDPGKVMGYAEAADYHGRQAAVLTKAGVDMLSAITMTNVNEAIGITRAAERVGLPVAISFTVETDGRLPTGDGLGDAIAEVDDATAGYPAYYMVNCAHPTHFSDVLMDGGAWAGRLRGIRANASRCSHAELDAMTTLDDGDPAELGQLYQQLRDRLPQLTVLGGCCGTDIRHLTAIADACCSSREATAAA
jgi:S-methylmethionine-dependent homocysteine/selenocysteine methylase